METCSSYPGSCEKIVVQDASQVEAFASQVDFIFCAVDMKKNEIQALEEAYAKTGTPVVSNNSAHRWTADVPMVIPEINPGHLEVIEAQRKRLGTKTGFIAVKPNCSIQSYVPALHALREFNPTQVVASTYQAISGAGKNFTDWPEMLDNVIPYIGGEEEKSEQEPLRIWGSVQNNEIVKASSPLITTQCIRVPVTDGHLATVFVNFEKNLPKMKFWSVGCNSKGVRKSWNCQVHRNSLLRISRKKTDRKRSLIVTLNAEWAYPREDCAKTRSMIINSWDCPTTRSAEQQAVRF